MSRRLALVVAVLAAGALIAPATANAALPRGFYGVVTQGGLGPDDARLMNEGGVRTLRFHLDWRAIQAEPGRCQAAAELGVCDWRGLDYGIGLLASAGVRAFPFVLNVPWFVDEDSNVPPTRSRSDRRAWTGFITALVGRYGQGGEYWRHYFASQFPGSLSLPITHWQVWNEPSDGSYWQPRPDPEEYARLLELTGRAIHDIEKRANVVSAGLSGTPDERNDGIRAPKYYPSMFARKGISRHVDTIAVHPYGRKLKNLRTQMKWLLEATSEAGLRDHDVWVTELGWTSSEEPGIGLGREGQARYLTSRFKLLKRQRREWNIAGIHWYAWQDLAGPGLCGFCPEAGLVTFDRQPKPSYYAFAEIAR